MSPSRIQKFTQPSVSTNNNATTTTKPPRPMNCFLLYRHEKQKEILAQCPGANHRDISKIIAKWWRQATAEEKEPYVKKAALEKIKHAQQYPAYKFMPQKKSKNGTRIYKRRTQDEFTSKSKELNDCMKIMYHADNTSSLPSTGDAMPTNATNSNTATSGSMPTINVNMVPSSLLLPSMNEPAPFIINMSSPSSSSLSLSSMSSSPSSLSSPYYHPYTYHDTMTASSFLLKDNTPLGCSFYPGNGEQGIENNSLGDQIQMNALSLNPSYNDDLTNLCLSGDYFYQPQQQTSLFDTTTSPCPSIYSNYTTYGHSAYPYDQGHQQQYQERSLSPSDFYIDPSLACQDLTFNATYSPDSLL